MTREAIEEADAIVDVGGHHGGALIAHFGLHRTLRAASERALRSPRVYPATGMGMLTAPPRQLRRRVERRPTPPLRCVHRGRPPCLDTMDGCDWLRRGSSHGSVTGRVGRR